MANYEKAGIAALCSAVGIAGWLTWAGACFADSLIVTYSDGRTQRVVLDGPGAEVKTIHLEQAPAESGAAGEATSISALYVRPAAEQDITKRPSTKKVQFKWGTPKTGE